MRYPKFLNKGGTIGFLAPSFGCGEGDYRTAAFDNALRKWREMGYTLVLGPNCYAAEGVGISNTPEKCGREVMDSFLSEDSDCLISCGGGELMCEILPYVDFGKLAAAEPKWFMGYSDNTNLTYLLATLADTASVYGPCAGTFGMEPWHESLYDAFGILTGEKAERTVKQPDDDRLTGETDIRQTDAGRTAEIKQTGGSETADRQTAGARVTVGGYAGWEKESLKGAENPLAPYHLTETRILRTYMGREQISAAAAFSGRLLGGCLDCLVNLLGTRFDRTREFVERYQEDGIIWFLEACDLNVFSIRRAMWQMEEAGWLKHVKGFLIGRPLNGNAMMNLDAYDAVLEVAGRKNVPVVMDVDLGHLPPMMPLVVGSAADVAVKGNDIRI
ncbi:MAG TPA: hypothetical protein DCZ91_05070, partial [Lachnospiraceae bacterium]|nr:hypothetical protein [Lachnospiraceae bacterium]